ncbi:glycosyltransferase family 2 protein [Thiopseudomonas alkaliphila]|uniref:glycosyltransferase family 2 protein n=1 Tax=Thiopseudomonas alkaliphila TaxID=1697053 RepID=UPI00069CFE7A|nr:glycosyltransferase family 2 protein [Thiopseudomonas alkaliphila]
MSSSPVISIIIPVYGVEKYIAKCIKSIKQQVFTSFEAILINDGTKDDSVAIAEQTIADDERFIILHKENGGQGSARNLGLDKASGEYITFIDSDDYVEPRFLQAMYEKIVAENSDVCACGVSYVDGAGKVIRLFQNNPIAYKKTDDYLMANWYISNFMCDKLFKKTIFNRFRFDTSLRTNEDVYLLFEMLYGKSITAVNESLYNYLQRPHATSKGAPPTYIEDRVKVVKKQMEFAKKLGREQEDKIYLKTTYLKHFLFNVIVTLSRYSNNFSEDIKKLKGKVDPSKYSFKNIFFMIKKEKKIGLSLLLFKLSPQAFRLFARFWFRNHIA